MSEQSIRLFTECVRMVSDIGSHNRRVTSQIAMAKMLTLGRDYTVMVHGKNPNAQGVVDVSVIRGGRLARKFSVTGDDWLRLSGYIQVECDARYINDWVCLVDGDWVHDTEGRLHITNVSFADMEDNLVSVVD